MREFTYTKYKNMLSALLRRGYVFHPFSRCSIESPYCLLRHDIDYNPYFATALSEIEVGLGIKATYFVWVGSPRYNIFSKDNAETILDLSKKHYVGLHFDAEAHKTNIYKTASKEICLLKDYFDIDVKIMSFHRPVKEDYKIPCAGSHEVRIPYFSDAFGMWKYGDPLESQVFKNKQSMQLSIHPIWWVS